MADVNQRERERERESTVEKINLLSRNLTMKKK